MPLSPADLTKQIKAANDIVDVISGYLAVEPAGKNYKAICPFHQDTRPSLQIDRQWQNYHCWACGAKGDVLTFIEKYEKLGFKEARALLAQRAGIKLEDEPQGDDPRVRLLEAMRWAQQVYQLMYLESQEAAPARTYMGERQLSGVTIRQFGIGYAPLSGDWLVQQAVQHNVDPEFLVQVGLIAPRDEGKGFYDRFRDRVMFPIKDIQGRVVAFGGRILPHSPLASRAPKYYNSPETPLFHKSSVIFALDLARHSGAKEGYLAVVEGYTDVMMAHQCGITNVVATMGTALTANHVSQLRRYAPKVQLVYDADAGGQTGVDRALEIFASQDVELAIATLPAGLDPCDLLVKENGIDTFRAALSDAADALDFKLKQLLAKPDSKTLEGQRRTLDAVLGVMAMAPTVPSQNGQLKQQLMITRLAQRVGVRQESVWARLRELKAKRTQAEARTNPVPTQPEYDSPKSSGRAPILERQLLQILLADPLLVPMARTTIPALEVTHTGLRRMLDELYGLHDLGQMADLDGLRVRLIDRPDLVSVALDLQLVGRGISDRALWLEKIAHAFKQRTQDESQRAVRNQLALADEGQQIELLRMLQSRGRMAPM